MRLALLAILSSATTASADPPKPDFVLVWNEGEVSLDMSISTIEITVTGNKVHFKTSYMGRMPLPQSDRAGDGTVKDPKKLAAALAALDKAPAVKRKETTEPYSGQEIEACITRGKTKRCVIRHDGDKPAAEVAAITAVRDAALEGIPLTDLIGE